ncbi:siderophore-interacting protein [Streptomyces sp. WM6378]|uniref:siderophore-interacting protein n=1 Tax=Streptomyces sp. WM6378 TaxID=1415557 RepID=UPI00099DC77E|nr:siderophore-interacting protein [Streptomyces sp. WM6378]
MEQSAAGQRASRSITGGPTEHSAAGRSLPVRFVEAAGVRRIAGHMVRVTFGGADLADFRVEGPDQQIKLYFPRPGQSVPVLPAAGADGDFMRWYQAFQEIPEPRRPWMRSYTVRAHDTERGTIDIDFVLHAGADGPATRWARTAAPGAVLGMFGPSAYFATPVPIATTDWMLLVADESGLPALATIVEALPKGARAVAYIEVNGPQDELALESPGELTVHWLHRAPLRPGTGEVLVRAVRAAEFPPGSAHAWLAGEAGAVRAVRRQLVAERGLPKRSVSFAGYWRHRLTQDDAPTEADLAEARERAQGWAQ